MWPPPPPDTIISKDASPSIEKATTGSPLVRAILESASDQFLDLAVGVRLQTIGAKELVKLLAKTKRLGIRRQTSSMTKTVSILSRKRMQVLG